MVTPAISSIIGQVFHTRFRELGTYLSVAVFVQGSVLFSEGKTTVFKVNKH